VALNFFFVYLQTNMVNLKQKERVVGNEDGRARQFWVTNESRIPL